MESVFAQTFTDYEYIIIDGGSTDGSREYIEQCSQKLAYRASGKDAGVYDAMNKGIMRASGDYLLMLNSGDYLYNNILEKVSPVFQSDVDIIYGNLFWINDNEELFPHRFPAELQYSYFRDSSLGHQSAFIKRTLHEKVGMYDTGLRFVSDWKFFVLALFRYNATTVAIREEISVCDRKGISCDPANWNLITDERRSVLQNDFPGFEKDYAELEANRALVRQIELSRWVKLGRKFGFLKPNKQS